MPIFAPTAAFTRHVICALTVLGTTAAKFLQPVAMEDSIFVPMALTTAVARFVPTATLDAENHFFFKMRDRSALQAAAVKQKRE